MNLKLAVLVTALLSCGTMYADTVTVNLGPSTQNYSLLGTGGSGGYGTYLVQQGTCAAGAVDTTCTLSGSYTGTTTGFTSGTYSLVTTYLNADGGLPATSSEPVVPPNQGNYFFFNPFSPDVNMTLNLDDVSGDKTLQMVFDGTFLANSFGVNPVSATSGACAGLPDGVACTQGNVGLYDGASLFGPVTGFVVFDQNLPVNNFGNVPEPEWLALGGMIPGAFVMLRRKFLRAV